MATKKNKHTEVESVRMLKGRYMKPICPFCRSKMKVMMYKGYYESFPFWNCDCKDSELKHHVVDTIVGDYG